MPYAKVTLIFKEDETEISMTDCERLPVGRLEKAMQAVFPQLHRHKAKAVLAEAKRQAALAIQANNDSTEGAFPPAA